MTMFFVLIIKAEKEICNKKGKNADKGGNIVLRRTKDIPYRLFGDKGCLPFGLFLTNQDFQAG